MIGLQSQMVGSKWHCYCLNSIEHNETGTKNNDVQIFYDCLLQNYAIHNYL